MQRRKRERRTKKKFANHRIQAKREREYYHQNTKKAKEQRELVEQNFLEGRTKYSSINATAHYSFDWAQNVQVPHYDQQPSQMYYLSPYKVHLFGVQNEATREQINYIIGESELLDKSPNGTLSLVFNAIKKLNRSEKHLKLTCDNAVGQNKNNTTIQFCQFLIMAGYYETIELNFMIAGHTKFKVDGNFGLIKRLYRKSTVYSIEQFAEVVRKSSPARLNKVQYYKNGKGLRYLDIKSLGTYFEKLGGIQKYHHFLFSSDNLGVVKVQEEADGEFKEFNLLKTDGREISEIIKEIGNLTFTELLPPPLKSERQEYLYQNIRPLLPEGFRDINYPQPIQREITSNISPINLLS